MPKKNKQKTRSKDKWRGGVYIKFFKPTIYIIHNITLILHLVHIIIVTQHQVHILISTSQIIHITMLTTHTARPVS